MAGLLLASDLSLTKAMHNPAAFRGWLYCGAAGVGKVLWRSAWLGYVNLAVLLHNNGMLVTCAIAKAGQTLHTGAFPNVHHHMFCNCACVRGNI